MIPAFRRQLIFSLASVFALLVGFTTVSANTIGLNGLIDANIDQTWETGDKIILASRAPGMGPDPYIAFDPIAEFYLETTSYDDGLYSGFFSVKRENETIISAQFDDLSASFSYSVMINDWFINESYDFDIEIQSFSSAMGTLTLEDFNVDFLNGSWGYDTISWTGSGVTISEKETFEGTVSLVANPEPGTFFLLGFGLLGVAGIGRRRRTA